MICFSDTLSWCWERPRWARLCWRTSSCRPATWELIPVSQVRPSYQTKHGARVHFIKLQNYDCSKAAQGKLKASGLVLKSLWRSNFPKWTNQSKAVGRSSWANLELSWRYHKSTLLTFFVRLPNFPIDYSLALRSEKVKTHESYAKIMAKKSCQIIFQNFSQLLVWQSVFLT